MSVTAQTPLNISTAAPGATSFPYDFKILAKADLLVQVDGVAKVVDVDYTVSGIAEDAGGDIEFVVPMTGGEVVTRKRSMLFHRLTDFQNLGDLRSATLNNDQDAPILMIQQLAAFALQAIIDANGEFVWDAQQHRIVNVADATGEQDAVNLRQLLLEIELALSGGPTYGVAPKYWQFTGDGVQTDFPIPLADIADPVFYDVMLDRLGQEPTDDYTIILGDDLEDSVIRFGVPPVNLKEGWVVLRGYARAYTDADPVTGTILESALRMRIVTEADAAFELTATDHARALVITTNAAAVTATLDENLVASFEKGDYFSIKQGGDGAVTVDTSAVTITVPVGYLAKPRAKDCIITFTCEDRDTNAWAVSGEMAVDGASVGDPFDGALVVEPSNTLTSSAGVLTVDLSLGNLFRYVATENVTSVVLTNEPASGFAKAISLVFVQHASAAKTFAMPAGWKWAGGTIGVVSTGLSAVDELNLVIDNATGTKLYRAALAKGFA